MPMSRLDNAAYQGNTTEVRNILKEGEDVNQKNEFGNTALHYSARFGHTETCRVLIEYGADPLIVNNRGDSALDIMKRCDKQDMKNLKNLAAEIEAGRVKSKESKSSQDCDKHLDEMKEMLDNAKEYYSDVVLQCEDGQVDCHKNILCLKSSYFKNMFDSGKVEAKSGRIPVSLDKESCMVLLEYLYTGRLDGSKVTVKLLLEVNKMLMDDLKEICMKELADNIRMENVVEILEMTDRVEQFKDLQKAAEQYIVNNRKDLTPELKQELRNYSNVANLMFKILEQYW